MDQLETSIQDRVINLQEIEYNEEDDNGRSGGHQQQL